MIENIKTILEAIGLTYVRALNVKDLNEIVAKTEVNELGVLSGLIGIDADFKEETYQAVELWDISVMFLSLSPSLDATGGAVDDVLSDLYAKAHEFIRRFQETIPPGYYLESYNLISTDSVNITTEVLIGWTLTFQAPYIANLCPPS